MTHAIEHVAFILGPHLILFSDKDSSVFEGGDWLDFDGLNNNYLRIWLDAANAAITLFGFDVSASLRLVLKEFDFLWVMMRGQGRHGLFILLDSDRICWLFDIVGHVVLMGFVGSLQGAWISWPCFVFWLFWMALTVEMAWFIPWFKGEVPFSTSYSTSRFLSLVSRSFSFWGAPLISWAILSETSLWTSFSFFATFL